MRRARLCVVRFFFVLCLSVNSHKRFKSYGAPLKQIKSDANGDDQGAYKCNGVFMRIGVPDTEYAFEYWKLEEAKLEFSLASLKLSQSDTTNAVVDGIDHTEATQCKELLAK